MVDDNFFILGLFCYGGSSFCSHGFYLHRIVFLIFCSLFVFGFFSLACVYSCFHLPCTFDGWVLVLDLFYLFSISITFVSNDNSFVLGFFYYH